MQEVNDQKIKESLLHDLLTEAKLIGFQLGINTERHINRPELDWKADPDPYGYHKIPIEIRFSEMLK
jgi:hypothetical protein